MTDTRTDAELNERIARWICVYPPPDYSGDLNVWGDIYNGFRADRWTTSSAFLKQLLTDLDVGDVTGDYGWLTMIFSTARQRAEALVAVIEGAPKP